MRMKYKVVCLWAMIAFLSVFFSPGKQADAATPCRMFAGHYAPAGCSGTGQPPAQTPTPGNAPTPAPPTAPPPIFMPPPPAPPPGTPAAACASGSSYEDFKKHLLLREGYRDTVYLDSLGKPTVGVGHLVLPGDNLKVGDKITKAQVDTFLDKDAQAAWNAGQTQAANAGVSNPCFASALASVSFQLGLGWRTKFPRTWSLIVAGQYKDAAQALNGTIWQKQTPVRVKDFQDALMEMEKAKTATP